MKRSSSIAILGVSALTLSALLGGAGCGRDSSVQVYNVDTNDTLAATAPAAPAAAPAGAMPSTMPPGLPTPDSLGLPSLNYTVPAGWQQKAPSQMRVASFSVSSGGQSADVSVVPLGGMGGGDLANVNRWRGQIGQPALTDDQLKSLAEAVTIGGQSGTLYDLAGSDSEGAPSQRILGTILYRGDTVWFFKMEGAADLVEKQKPSFIAFLKSVQFGAASPGSSASTAPAPLGAVDPNQPLPPSHPSIDNMSPMGNSSGMPAAPAVPLPQWTVPAGWQPGPLAQFLVAKFIVNGDAGTRAEVNVSSLTGDGGGLLPNVNRWRQQLGLAPVADEAGAQAQSLTVPGGTATVVDFSGVSARTGQPARLVGVMQSVGGQTWFYKLMGDAAVVAAQKDALLKLVQSARYPGAS